MLTLTSHPQHAPCFPLWFRAILLAFTAFIMMTPIAPAAAQPCTFPEDVKFVIRTQLYSQTPFVSRQIEDETGPRVGGWPGVIRVFGDLTQIGRRTSNSGSVSGWSVSYEMANDVRVNALRTAGNIYGGGQLAIVDIYVRHRVPGPNQPFWVEWTETGSLLANHPAGLGRTDAFFTSFSAQSVNGQGEVPVPFSTRRFIDSQLTSSTELAGYQGYFYATTVQLDMKGWVAQSIDFCPFCPPTVFQYRSNATASGQIKAGPGRRPSCDGSVSLSTTSACTDVPRGGRREISRAFNINAQFSGVCECCEYRQYVRKVRRWAEDRWFADLGSPVFRDSPDNCLGQSRDTSCFAEDSDPTLVPGQCTRYGHRGDSNQFRTACADGRTNDLYGDGASDRDTACTYAACDNPTFTLKPGRKYIIEWEFEGQVVAVAGRCNMPAEQILARDTLRMCCTGTSGESGPVECANGPAPFIIPSTVSRSLSIAGRPVRIALYFQQGHLFVTAAVTTTDGISLSRDDVSASIAGLTFVPPAQPLGELDTVSTAKSINSYADFVFAFPGCAPNSVECTVTLFGTPVTFIQDLSSIAPPPRSDFNRNGTVDFFDYLDFVSAFAADDPNADFNSNGTVDFFDYLDFVNAFAQDC